MVVVQMRVMAPAWGSSTHTVSDGCARKSISIWKPRPEIAMNFSPRLRALLGYTPHGAGDDQIGGFDGVCAAWLDTPPEPAWREDRGQIGGAAEVKAQTGD